MRGRVFWYRDGKSAARDCLSGFSVPRAAIVRNVLGFRQAHATHRTRVPRIEKLETFQVVMQLVLFPMLFLSGALFPLSGLPRWLMVLTRINPLTYAVAPLRQVVFAAQDIPPQAAARFSAQVTIFGYTLSIWAELAIVTGFLILFFALAVQGLSRRS